MDARRRNKHATVAIPFALIQSGCSWKCILLICKVFLLAHLSVWRGLVYAWLLMAKLRYKTQTKSTLKGSLNLNRSSNSAIVAVFYHLWDGKQIDYFEVACFAVHHCIALFCFKKHQKQHLKIIEQGVFHQKYVTWPEKRFHCIAPGVPGKSKRCVLLQHHIETNRNYSNLFLKSNWGRRKSHTGFTE